MYKRDRYCRKSNYKLIESRDSYGSELGSTQYNNNNGEGKGNTSN